jgi:hypothetical protein
LYTNKADASAKFVVSLSLRQACSLLFPPKFLGMIRALKKLLQKDLRKAIKG